MELALGGAILFGLYRLAVDLRVLGYLPAPFFHDKTDSFMDWYNPGYWAHNPGAYDEWYSIYPPLSFLFIDVFSRPSCYHFSADVARACDPQGYWLLSAMMIFNLALTWLSYRKIDPGTAAPRAVAVCLGVSMLFGWERGNLIIPCYSFFVLAHGNLLKRGWLKTFCAAVTINFKPYLIVAAAGHLLRRDWRWLEQTALWSIGIYAVAYMLFQAGDPVQVLTDTVEFASGVTATGYGQIEFTTTYTEWLHVLNSTFPIMQFVGSGLMEAMEQGIPIAIDLGLLGVAISLIGGGLQPGALSRSRISALCLLALQSVSRSEGGYALVFALFFVFLEPWRGIGRIMALLSAYLWCFPLDLDVSGLTYSTSYSFLTNRTVDVNMPLTLGQIARPAVILLIEYGLALASFGDLLRHAGVWRRWTLPPKPAEAFLAERPGPA